MAIFNCYVSSPEGSSLNLPYTVINHSFFATETYGNKERELQRYKPHPVRVMNDMDRKHMVIAEIRGSY